MTEITCTCGYRARKVEPAQTSLGPHHDINQHLAYMTGSTDKLLEIAEENYMVPKDSDLARRLFGLR